MQEDRFFCPKCGGPNVSAPMWVYLNTLTDGQPERGEVGEFYGSWNNLDLYCGDCGESYGKYINDPAEAAKTTEGP